MCLLHCTQCKLSCKTRACSDHFTAWSRVCGQQRARSICDTVCLSKLHTSALSVITFVEVLTGKIDDEKHVGKMLVYLEQLLKLNPARHHVYGALTNLRYTTLYCCRRGHDTSSFERTQAVCMNTGTNLFVCVVHVAIPLSEVLQKDPIM